MKHSCTFMFCLMVLPFTLLAQEAKKGSLSFTAGVTSASDDFADTDLTNVRSGNAGAGIFIGLNKTYQVKKKGVSLFWGIDALYNPYSKDAKDRIEDGLANDEEIKFPSYINLPLSGGGEYRFAASPDVEIFGKAGIVLDFLRKTTGVRTQVNKDDLINTHPISTGLGLLIGGGISLKKKFSIGLGYNFLGNHRVKGTWERGASKGRLNTQKLDVKLLALYVSFPLQKK